MFSPTLSPAPFPSAASDAVPAMSFQRASPAVVRAFSLAEQARDTGKSTPASPADPTIPVRAEMTDTQAREAAQEFVSLSLVQPVLAQLRKTNQAWGPFKPGAHEKQFGPLIDGQIAMRLTKAQNFPLVDAIARNLLEASQRLAAAAGPLPGPPSAPNSSQPPAAPRGTQTQEPRP